MRIIFSELPGSNLTGKGGRGRLHRRTVPKQLHGTMKFPRSPCVGSLCCSVAKSGPTLWPHGLHYARIPCPSLSPGVCSNSCPSSRWCYLTILSSAALFSVCLRSFPASRSFPVSQPFSSGGQSFGASASASVLSMNIQGWFPLGWTGWISLLSQGTLKNLLQHNLKASILQHWAFFMVSHSHPYMTTGKTIALSIQTFVSKAMSLLFNMLSTFVIAFLPRCKRLLISWLQWPSTVILEPKKIKSVTASTFSPFICHEVMGSDSLILVFECWVLSQLFHSPLSPSSRGFLVPLHFLPLVWYHLHIWDCWYFSWQCWFQLMIHSAWHFPWYTLHVS